MLILLSFCCFGYCSSWDRERKEKSALEERCESYQKIVEDYQKQERVVWEHAKSLPDSFLLEFYPDAENVNTLRQRLADDYAHYDEDV